MTDYYNRLEDELRLLYASERDYKVPAAPIVRQLVVDANRPLPDLLPPVPEFRQFQWPKSGIVDCRPYWRDR